jgi:hypothetical protein
MSSLAKKIKRAPDLPAVYNCLDELQALIALAGRRIKELEAEEVEQRIAETMSADFSEID